MPTVLYPDCFACCSAHGWSCASVGDRYSIVRSLSAACRCGSPVPPNQTSVFGFAFSAISCASASPEPFSDMLTLMPVDFANTVWIMLHQSACTEQITLTWPCWAPAPAAQKLAANSTATRRIAIDCLLVAAAPGTTV